MAETDSEKRKGGRESRMQRQKEAKFFLGTMSGRFCHVLLESRGLGMEREGPLGSPRVLESPNSKETEAGI